MPALPDYSLPLPHVVVVWLALAVCILVAWAAYAIPQYVAIEHGWPRVYRAAPYTAVVAGAVAYALAVEHTLMSFSLGAVVIWAFVGWAISGPGYEHGRELYERYGDDWTDHWEPSMEVPV